MTTKIDKLSREVEQAIEKNQRFLRELELIDRQHDQSMQAMRQKYTTDQTKAKNERQRHENQILEEKEKQRTELYNTTCVLAVHKRSKQIEKDVQEYCRMRDVERRDAEIMMKQHAILDVEIKNDRKGVDYEGKAQVIWHKVKAPKGCFLHIYRDDNKNLCQTPKEVLERGCDLIHIESEPNNLKDNSDDPFIDENVGFGRTYNYYVFFYMPVEGYRPTIHIEGRTEKELIKLPNGKTVNFEYVIPEPIVDVLSYGFIPRKITIPTDRNAIRAAETAIALAQKERMATGAGSKKYQSNQKEDQEAHNDHSHEEQMYKLYGELVSNGVAPFEIVSALNDYAETNAIPDETRIQILNNITNM